MREAFAGHYANTIMLEGVLVAAGLAVVCLAARLPRLRPRERLAPALPRTGLALHPRFGLERESVPLITAAESGPKNDYGLGTHFVPISGGSLLAATAA